MKAWTPVTNPNCTSCDLHESARSVCIPTSIVRPPIMGPVTAGFLTDKNIALLIVGEAPGALEDKQNLPFVGPSGQFLRDVYIKSFDLEKYADIYLSNAVRCRPPHNATPSVKHRTACRPYLLEDIESLKLVYDRVAILCVGASATQQVLKLTLTKALRANGLYAASPLNIRVFSTYHPAYIMPHRSPTTITSVRDHLNILLKWLEKESDEDKVGAVVKAPFLNYARASDADLVLLTPSSRISLDIETYGFIEGLPEQNYFHPRKSMEFDGVQRKDLVQTASLSWTPIVHLTDCPPKETLTFDMQSREEAKLFRCTLLRAKNLSYGDKTLVGMNLVFDLMYLRAWDPIYNLIFDDKWLYQDIAILNYLENELRPERDLESIVNILQIGIPYVDKGKRTFSSSSDSSLHAYNALDSFNTLLCADELERRICSEYGENTPKLSLESRQWYSRLIQLALHMTEAGVSMDKSSLQLMLQHRKYAMKALESKALLIPLVGGPIKGKGSQLHVDEVLQSQCSSIPGIKTTTVEHKVSSDEENRDLILKETPSSSDLARFFRTLGSFRSHQKIVTSYLLPLLVGRGKRSSDHSSKLIPLNGTHFVYPSWFLVPSRFDDRDGSDGGTNQGRIICKRPALQTAPPSISKSFTTRFKEGTLLHYDLSQIEMRVAALLSNDTIMLSEYEQDLDRHEQTASLIFGEFPCDVSPTQRQVGKTVNFLMLYRGGVNKLIDTIRKDCGLSVSYPWACDVLKTYWHKYFGLKDWQDELIERACTEGYIILPILGQSRRFLGSPAMIRKKDTPTIVNFPVQCTAANILVSAQTEIRDAIQRYHLRSVMPLQVFDSVDIDCPSNEVKFMDHIVEKALTQNSYFTQLCNLLGRTIPIQYKRSEKL